MSIAYTKTQALSSRRADATALSGAIVPGAENIEEGTAGARETPAGIHSKQDGSSVELSKRCQCEEHVTTIEFDA